MPSERPLIDRLKDRQDIMVATTQMLSDINSGSYNTHGIKKVNHALVDIFSPLCDKHIQIPTAPTSIVEDDGTLTQFHSEPMEIFSIRPDAKVQVLCTGHSDTVFPKTSDFQTSWIEGNVLRGPGVADMKGGLIVLYHALEAIHHSDFRDDIGFTIALSPDEEIGSPASAKILSELAKQSDFGLTYEPALSDGTLAGARKGSGNFSIVIKGLSTHAGRDFFSGRNAITAAARVSILLESLSHEANGVSVNIGKISGGGAVNVVPDTAVCRFNVRTNTIEQQTMISTEIQRCIHEVMHQTQCQLSLHGGFNRPPKNINKQQQDMFDLLKICGKQLDLDINFKPTGGCCEGNNLSAAGLVNIDTLGVRGGKIHSDEEFACIDSFVERAQLSALLIAKLSQHKKING